VNTAVKTMLGMKSKSCVNVNVCFEIVSESVSVSMSVSVSVSTSNHIRLFHLPMNTTVYIFCVTSSCEGTRTSCGLNIEIQGPWNLYILRPCSSVREKKRHRKTVFWFLNSVVPCFMSNYNL